MSTVELRKQLIDKIETISDDNILAELYRFVEINESDDEVYDLSPEIISAINEGLEDVKNGRVKSHEEVKRTMTEWLSK